MILMPHKYNYQINTLKQQISGLRVKIEYVKELIPKRLQRERTEENYVYPNHLNICKILSHKSKLL